MFVFSPICYRMQFCFVSVGMCTKWDALIRKGLKLKSGLPLNFSSNTIHHPSFYGLKSFSQSQSEFLVGVGPVDICGSDNFMSVCNHLSWIGVDSLSVYTNESLKNLGIIGCKAGAAVFFEDINLSLGISVWSLVSSTLAELQAITLALECIPVACSVCLFSDSQAALDACMSEVNLGYPDFHNQCWVEHQHIRNVIHSKNLRVSWHKVKNHFGVLENDRADSIADAATLSDWFFSTYVDEHFLLADDSIVFDIDWPGSSRIWHPDSHMATDFTSRCTANTRTYLMKTLHHQLPMVV
ncbi:hypothetical protein G9A89_008459 [Geosiphon pyriformis]|nr:hypothetical protein G9A89_008459 [Geosiphon pyriformis]